MNFFKKYRLYILVSLPVVIAMVAAAIIVAADNPGSTADAAGTAAQSTSAPYRENIAETTAPEPEYTDLITEISETQDGTLVLSGSVTVPVFSNPGGSDIIDSVNNSLATLGNRFLSEAKDKPLTYAKTELAAGGDDLPYTYDARYSVALCSDTVISVVFTVEKNLGDEHEAVSVYCVNYSLSNGKELSLSDIFSCGSGVFLPEIHSYVETRISADPSQYYSDYAGLIELMDYSDKWYFSPNGFVIVYEPYEIASYSAGVVSFTIPCSELSDILAINPHCGS